MLSGPVDLRNTTLRTAGLLVLLGFSVTAAEQPASAESKAHQHGVGQLNLAIDGKDVEMELIAPGADIVGFEHKPKSVAQKQSVADAAGKLKDGKSLFRFPAGAQCRLADAEVESSLLEEDDHKDHKGHKEHSHHKEHHDHKGHKDHKDEHKHGGEEEHAEFHAHYHFKCADPAQITHMDVEYFSTFPNAETLSVQKITPSGQSVQRLTAKAARLTF